MIPALHDVDGKELAELLVALRDLIARARAGRLKSSDATVTLTSLGDLGVETVYGVIYPPQVALVGFGKILEQPWVDGGQIGVRPVLSATLAGDHCATDGRRGAEFLDALARHLQSPAPWASTPKGSLPARSYSPFPPTSSASRCERRTSSRGSVPSTSSASWKPSKRRA